VLILRVAAFKPKLPVKTIRALFGRKKAVKEFGEAGLVPTPDRVAAEGGFRVGWFW